VISVDAQPILGLSTCRKLGLIQQVDTINCLQGLTKAAIQEQYKSVFTGLGNLGKYHITLQENRSPIVNPPRRVPHLLKGKFKQTIEKTVKSGVLDKPTDWVYNLIIVEKKNASLRLCLDPREFIKVVKRENY